MRYQTKTVLGCLLASTLFVESADAGGFGRGGVEIDLLFAEEELTFEAGTRIIFPQRTLETATKLVNSSGQPTQTSSTNVNVNSQYYQTWFGGKFDVGDHVDCLGSYSEPFGANVNNGLNTAVSASAVEFELNTRDFGLTCSAKFDAGQTPVGAGQFRLIGGLSYLQFDGSLSRQTFVDFVGIPAAFLPAALTGLNTQAVGQFTFEDETFGWRLGVAYEIPEIAARISLVYNSSYEINGTGQVDISAFNTPAALANSVSPISFDTEIPQSVDFRLQSGVTESMLLFGEVRWQEWSRIQSVPVSGVPSPVTGLESAVFFEPLYRDGITVTGGAGYRFTDDLSGGASLTWDRGTSTTVGTQSDTWLLSLGLQYDINEHFTARLGGAAGILTSGSTPGTGQQDQATAAAVSFGNDFVGALNASLKVNF
ncbi:MAG: outer membrane protein transport protein [Pseudomonadota bacterium]